MRPGRMLFFAVPAVLILAGCGYVLFAWAQGQSRSVWLSIILFREGLEFLDVLENSLTACFECLDLNSLRFQSLTTAWRVDLSFHGS